MTSFPHPTTLTTFLYINKKLYTQGRIPTNKQGVSPISVKYHTCPTVASENMQPAFHCKKAFVHKITTFSLKKIAFVTPPCTAVFSGMSTGTNDRIKGTGLLEAVVLKRSIRKALNI